MKTVVISLGGSILSPAPGRLDEQFIEEFRLLIDEYLTKDYRFIIFTGGGKIARAYQEYALIIKEADENDLDWIGIMATRLNAEYLRTIFSGKQNVIYDPTKKVEFKNDKVLVGAGWKPGWSTDYDAVKVAINVGATDVINMSNIKHVYDKDPNKYNDAKPFEHLTWKEYRKMVGDVWEPGLNAPFDPIASKEAQKKQIKVHIIDRDLQNLSKVLRNEEYVGTTIE